MTAEQHIYQQLIDQYLGGHMPVDQFVERFMQQWSKDRDNDTQHDPKFQRLINRIFTSCDCYSEAPELPVEITEEELRSELALLRHIWWG